nr:hypothetical protein CFP56_35412 [Quercus suber]
MGTKFLSEFFEGTNGIRFQAVKPSYRNWSQTGGENFAHQSFILGMDSHPLVEMAHMFHKVCSTIIDNECWLMKTTRESCLFNPTCERRSGDLVQGFAYSVVPYTSK